MPRRNPAGHFTHVKCRRRPTLPHPDECSTIGAGGLSFRVRDGTGRSPSATTTDNTIHISPLRGLNTPPHPHTPETQVQKGWSWLCAQGHTVDANNNTRAQHHAELVLWASPRPIST